MREITRNYIKTFENSLCLPGIAWWLIDYAESPKDYYCNDLMVEYFSLNPSHVLHSIDETCPIIGDYNKNVAVADREKATRIIDEYKQLLNGEVKHFRNHFPYFDQTQSKMLYFLSRAKVLHFDADGKPEILFGIIEDTTLQTEQQETLKRLSEKDLLTDLYSRPKIDKLLEEHVASCQTTNAFLSLILIDIDNVDTIKNSWGEHINDNNLRKLGRLVKDNVRKTDLPGRWANHEFIILCPGVSTDNAWFIAEKLRTTIQNYDFHSNETITASFGISEFTRSDTSTSLFSRADQALIQAKKRGRNCIATG